MKMITLYKQAYINKKYTHTIAYIGLNLASSHVGMCGKKCVQVVFRKGGMLDIRTLFCSSTCSREQLCTTWSFTPPIFTMHNPAILSSNLFIPVTVMKLMIISSEDNDRSNRYKGLRMLEGETKETSCPRNSVG